MFVNISIKKTSTETFILMKKFIVKSDIGEDFQENFTLVKISMIKLSIGENFGRKSLHW